MQKLFIIGNLTADPETKITQNGITVCSFTVAVNRRHGQEQKADFFRVAAWRQLGENCQKYLAKGRKVAVTGTVSVNAYAGKNGPAATLEVNADEVEFLTPKDQPKDQPGDGYVEVTDDDLPF